MEKGYHYGKIILNASAIRSTDAVTTAAAVIEGLSKKSLIVINGLDQNISVQIQGAYTEGSAFINVGTGQTVNAGVNDFIGQTEVAELVNYIPCVRATVTAAIIPTSGTVTIYVVATN